MTEPRFDSFGVEHLLAVAATLFVIAVVVHWIRRQSDSRQYFLVRALAGLLVAYRVVETTWRWRLGEAWPQLMPLHLCGMSILLTAIVLWFRSDKVFQVAYYWVTAGATMSLLTPDLQFGFPSFAFWSFFLGHGLPVLGIAVAVFVLDMRPQARSILWALAGTWMMGLVAAPFNLAFDTNYLFLRQKPFGATPFDYFGPWPWYLLVVNFVGLFLFALCYLPFLRRSESTLPFTSSG